MNINNLIEITDNLEQKIRAARGLTWEDIQYAMNCITEEKSKGLYGLVCFYAAFYLIHDGRQDECLYYLNESVRCLKDSPQESEMSRCYNLSGVAAHSQGNFVLAMEHYKKALVYAKRYNRQNVCSMITGNMADTYYRVGAYERAIYCYKECLQYLQRFGRVSSNGENMYLKVLGNYGYCLVIMKQMEKAELVANKLKQILSEEHVDDATVRLAVYGFLAFWAHSKGENKEAEQYTNLAVQAIAEGCIISVDYDNILNLIQYLIKAERYDSLRQVLDYMEPQAAIERNEGFLLQLLMLRLQYCSDEMDQESFLERAQTFFGLKNKHEFAENNQVLRIINLRNKLRDIEEEQARLEEENTKLLYQSEHDELSGLYNKRYLNRHMEEIFEEAIQKELPLGVMFVDIDYFKQMNDRYGHQKGDDCIVAISEAIKTCMPDDFAARYGGDEFVIITLGRTREYMETKAQLLVDNIKARKIPNADAELISIATITVGVAHAIPHKPNKMWDFLSAADETLYYQKKEQKGCVRFYVGNGDYL